MAFLDAIAVSIEIFDKGSWRTLEEFDIEDTLKEIANNVTRCTSAIQIRPGLFRFQIVAAESFAWGDANALKLVLTLDEGVVLDRYETLALKPGGDEVRRLVTDLRLDKNMIMDTTRSGASIYYLDSIWLPLEHASSDTWMRAEFEFDQLYSDRQLKLLSQNNHSNLEHGRIRIDVVPCQVSQNRGRSRILNPSERQLDQFSNLLAGTSFRWDPEKTVDKKYYHRLQPVVDHDTFSFIFLYSEVARSRAIPPEMIDQIQVDRSSKKTIGKGGKTPHPRRFDTQSPYKTTPMTNLSRKATPTIQERNSRLAVDNEVASSQPNRSDLPGRTNTLLHVDSHENIFGKTLDPNLTDGRVIVHQAQATSQSISVPDNDIDQNEENEPRSPLSASHMQQMQLELAVLDDTRRRVRAARVLRVQTEKAQNVQGLEQIDRKIEETEKLLSSLREQKHELLNDQKALDTQQTTFDVDVTATESLL